MNDWKPPKPADDLTVFIPKIPPARLPIEPLMRLPRWVGRLLLILLWSAIVGAGVALLFLTLRIVFAD